MTVPTCPIAEAVVTVPARPRVGSKEDLTLWFELDGVRVTARTEVHDVSWIHDHVRDVEARKRTENARRESDR